MHEKRERDPYVIAALNRAAMRIRSRNTVDIGSLSFADFKLADDEAD